MNNLVRLGQRLSFRIKTVEQEIEEECKKASESDLISFIKSSKKSA